MFIRKCVQQLIKAFEIVTLNKIKLNILEMYICRGQKNYFLCYEIENGTIILAYARIESIIRLKLTSNIKELQHSKAQLKFIKNKYVKIG